MIDDGNTRDEFAPEEHMSIEEMPDVQEDETLRDVVAALATLPPVSEADVQRIVARAAAEVGAGRREPRHRAATQAGRDHGDGMSGGAPKPRWFTSVPLAAAATLVLAAGIGGFVIRDLTMERGAGGPAAMATEAAPVREDGTTLTAVAADARAEAPVVTHFVLDAPAAAQVSLVGAFNGWDADATPLVRDAATGLWSVNVPLAPGRHVYAFMVDDSVLTLDPRAPKAQDPDLGTSGSVILVGTP